MMISNMVIILQPLLEKNRNSCFSDVTQNTHSQPELWHCVYTLLNGCICLHSTSKCSMQGKLTTSKQGGIPVAAESAPFQWCGQAPAAVISFKPKTVLVRSSPHSISI